MSVAVEPAVVVCGVVAEKHVKKISIRKALKNFICRGRSKATDALKF
jgi:hypothetical protein